MTENIGRDIQKLRGHCGPSTSRVLLLANIWSVSIAVSSVTFVIPASADGQTVVKMCREGEYPSAGDGSDDSDCEGEPEHIGEFALEAQVGMPEDTKRGPLPVLALGSFARYAHGIGVTKLEYSLS